MKILKKATAVMAALLIAVNMFAVSSSAAFAAPVFGGAEFGGFVSGALGAGGHSQSEIDGLDITGKQDLLTQDLRNGTITLDTPVAVPNASSPSVPFWDYILGDNYKVGCEIVNQAFASFGHKYLGIKDPNYYPLEGIENYVVPTLKTDLNGYGAMVYQYIPRSDGTIAVKRLPCDYIVIHCNDDGEVIHYKYCTNDGRTVWQEELREDGTWFSYAGFAPGNFITLSSDRTYKFFGDVRYEDDRPAPTDDEWEYQVGALPDGTAVTPDMINPDGTVTIDGVTYYPADYVDPDKLTDEGQAALTDAIADAIANTYVKADEDDKPIVDTDEITVEVAEELQDYMIPTGIATVFPFCLPFDFVRGMKLFSAEPVTPHFEVTINVPSILNIPKQQWKLVIDLKDFEPLAKITRWVSLIGFSYLLISLSTKIVKGAGA